MKTVNFIEAANSGKRFRPINFNHSGWLYVQEDELNDFIVMWNGYKQHATGELLNADFELEEKTISLTESQFNQVFWKYYEGCGEDGEGNSMKRVSMVKDLGFTDE